MPGFLSPLCWCKETVRNARSRGFCRGYPTREIVSFLVGSGRKTGDPVWDSKRITWVVSGLFVGSYLGASIANSLFPVTLSTPGNPTNVVHPTGWSAFFIVFLIGLGATGGAFSCAALGRGRKTTTPMLPPDVDATARAHFAPSTPQPTAVNNSEEKIKRPGGNPPAPFTPTEPTPRG
jgi:hypothetical protein